MFFHLIFITTKTQQMLMTNNYIMYEIKTNNNTNKEKKNRLQALKCMHALMVSSPM